MYRNIILHWTAGNYQPCATDIEHYHYLVDGDGRVHKGKYTPKDNENCTDGKYAAHCGGGNTGRIGIAICCRKDTKTPPTQKQVEAMCKLAAEVCYTYGLRPSQVITHAEFGLLHPKTASYGKIDINEISYVPVSGVSDTGNYLRNKVQWYYEKLK